MPEMQSVSSISNALHVALRFSPSQPKLAWEVPDMLEV
ncbi:hypothetical protein ACVIHF_000681 [Bradyrhizobium sp. USDA 4506]